MHLRLRLSFRLRVDNKPITLGQNISPDANQTGCTIVERKGQHVCHRGCIVSEHKSLERLDFYDVQSFNTRKIGEKSERYVRLAPLTFGNKGYLRLRIFFSYRTYPS